MCRVPHPVKSADALHKHACAVHSTESVSLLAAMHWSYSNLNNNFVFAPTHMHNYTRCRCCCTAARRHIRPRYGMRSSLQRKVTYCTRYASARKIPNSSTVDLCGESGEQTSMAAMSWVIFDRSDELRCMLTTASLGSTLYQTAKLFFKEMFH